MSRPCQYALPNRMIGNLWILRLDERQRSNSSSRVPKPPGKMTKLVAGDKPPPNEEITEVDAQVGKAANFVQMAARY